MARLDSAEVTRVPAPDAVARVLKATEAALYVFGSAPKALRWLSKPNRVLRGRSPSEMVAESEAGMQEVMEEIRRIEHSIYI